jgi:Ca2+-binding RTX toxin-like protein
MIGGRRIVDRDLPPPARVEATFGRERGAMAIAGETVAVMAELAAAADEHGSSLDDRLAGLGWANVTDRIDFKGGKLADGYYTHANAAGYVAYDAATHTLAIVLKGSDQLDSLGSASDVASDYLDATARQERHYDLLTPMIDAGLALADDKGGSMPVDHVLVTGHSLGAAMVEQFAARYTSPGGHGFDIQTAAFASPGLDFQGHLGPLAADLVRVEHTGDAVPKIADISELGLRQIGHDYPIDLPLIGDTGLDDGLSVRGYADILGNRELSASLYALTSTAVFGSELFPLASGDETIRAIISSDSKGDLLDYSWRHGSSAPEFLVSFGGDDTLSAGGGNDLIDGGTGDDILFGGTGDDKLEGGDGQDKLFGGDGRDLLLTGGGGRDHAHGGAGDDTLEGGNGADRLWGGSGEDHFVFADKGLAGAADIVEDWQAGETLYFRGVAGAAAFTIGDPFALGGGAADDVRIIVRDVHGLALTDLIVQNIGTHAAGDLAGLDGHILV